MTAGNQCNEQCLLMLRAVQKAELPHESCLLRRISCSLRLVTPTFPRQPMRTTVSSRHTVAAACALMSQVPGAAAAAVANSAVENPGPSPWQPPRPARPATTCGMCTNASGAIITVDGLADVDADQANLMPCRCSSTRQPFANPGYIREVTAPCGGYASVQSRA